MPGTRTSFEDHDCGVAQAVEAIGDQWCVLILRNLFMGMTRFDDFAAHLSISTKTLANRLQRMEAHGLLTATPDPHDKRGKIYQLTEKGTALGPVISALSLWGDKWEPKGDGSSRTEIYELATGKPIARVALVSQSGKILEGDDVSLRRGPMGSDVRDRLMDLVAQRDARKGAQ